MSAEALAEQIVAFCTRVVRTSPAADTLVLCHLGKRGGDSEIDRIELGDPLDYASEERMLELAERISVCCQEDADGQPGRYSRYYVQAEFAGRRPVRSRVMKLDTRDTEESDGDDIKDDLLRQCFSHINNCNKTIGQLVPSIAMAQADMLSRMQRQVLEADDRKLSTFEMLEELASRKHERDIMSRREERKDKMVGRAFDSFLPLAQGAVQRRMYKNKIPTEVAKSPFFLKLREAGKGIPEEAFSEFLSKLPPGVAITLIESFSEVMRDPEPEKKPHEPKQLPPARPPDGSFFWQ